MPVFITYNEVRFYREFLSGFSRTYLITFRMLAQTCLEPELTSHCRLFRTSLLPDSMNCIMKSILPIIIRRDVLDDSFRRKNGENFVILLGYF